MGLVLYHHGSSVCAAKVRYALEEKQLDWEGVYIDILKGEQFNPEFLAVNPKAVVPALVHDGQIITESTIICEYLEETFPENPLFPTSPLARAQVRFWTKAVDEELHPACSAVTYVVSHRHTLLRNGIGSFEEFLAQGGSAGKAARTLKWRWIKEGLSAPGVEEKIRLYQSYLKKMEYALADSDWLTGQQFSMADVAMAPYLNRLSALAMDGIWKNGKLPNVDRWFDQLQGRPAFISALKDWVPAELTKEMHANGQKSWPEIESLLVSA
jgi:glutathione S-transferase